MDDGKPVSPSDSQPEIDTLKRERARLRIAYMRLYKQYLDLDNQCRQHGTPFGDNTQ